MSVVQALFYEERDEKSMNINNYLDIIFFILSKILDFTKDSEEKTPSLFDHHHNHENDKESLSTSYSDSLSTDSDICCKIDKYDIEDFIIQIYKELGFNSNLLILSMMNLDKLLTKNFVLTDTNVHKVFFICMMETQKYYEDINFNNKDYAKVCGISTKELLELEIEFMNYMDFDMNIKDEDYFQYKKNLQKLHKKNIIIRNEYIDNGDDDSC